MPILTSKAFSSYLIKLKRNSLPRWSNQFQWIKSSLNCEWESCISRLGKASCHSACMCVCARGQRRVQRSDTHTHKTYFLTFTQSSSHGERVHTIYIISLTEIKNVVASIQECFGWKVFPTISFTVAKLRDFLSFVISMNLFFLSFPFLLFLSLLSANIGVSKLFCNFSFYLFHIWIGMYVRLGVLFLSLLLSLAHYLCRFVDYFMRFELNWKRFSSMDLFFDI